MLKAGKIALHSLWILCFVVIVSACKEGPKGNGVPKPSPGASGPMYEPPGGRPPFPANNYLYQAPSERIDHVLNGVDKLQLGMSRMDVRTILGAPDTENQLLDTTTYQGKNWTMKYLLRCTDPAGSNLKDSVLIVIFTREDKLTHIIREYLDKAKKP